MRPLPKLHYILSMGCVDGSSVQVRSFSIDGLAGWLCTLDHEGSSWGAVMHEMDDANTKVLSTRDVTDDVTAAYVAKREGNPR
jgi:hypothetical protein